MNIDTGMAKSKYGNFTTKFVRRYDVKDREYKYYTINKTDNKNIKLRMFDENEFNKLFEIIDVDW